MFLFFFCPPYSGVTIIICFCCTPTTQSHVLRIGQGREGTPPPQEHYYYFRVLLKEEKVWGSGKGGKGTPTHRSIITIKITLAEGGGAQKKKNKKQTKALGRLPVICSRASCLNPHNYRASQAVNGFY